MLHTRHLAAFFFKFLLAFVILMTVWPWVGKVYAPCFRASAGALFASFGKHGRVSYDPLAGDPDRDTQITLTNRRTGATEQIAGSSRLQGYKPTVFLVALIVATPVVWSRRWRALVWGLFWINVYVGIRVLVFVLVAFSGGDGLALITLGPVSAALLDFAYWFFVESFAGWLIVPLPIWFLLLFGRGDWPAVLNSGPAGRVRLPSTQIAKDIKG